jgi:hypothetical protein
MNDLQDPCQLGFQKKGLNFERLENLQKNREAAGPGKLAKWPPCGGQCTRIGF